MAGIPKVKITFDADFDELKRGVKGAQDEVEGFGGRMEKFGKAAGAAFAAAGAAALAYAGKLAIDGVKAAIEDEASQLRLANALRNVTGATDSQIKATEDYITKTSLALGVTDDQMRPALERLTRSTKDVEESQKLMSLAIDISKAKNLDLTTVSNALAKANDGQTGALKKLGITLGASAQNVTEYNKEQKALGKLYDELEMAQRDFGKSSEEYIKISKKIGEQQATVNHLQAQGIDWVGELSAEFAGAGTEAANTYAGKMERLRIAFDEAKETVGFFILNGLTPLMDTVVNNVIPNIGKWADSIGVILRPVIEYISSFIRDVFSPIVEAMIEHFKSVYSTLKDNKEIFVVLGTIIGGIALAIKNTLAPVINLVLVPALKIVSGIVVGLVTGFGQVAKVIVSVVEAIGSLINLVKNNPITRGIGNLIDGAFGGFRAEGGSVTGGKAYVVGEQGAELFVPSGNGTIVPNGGMGGSTINITVNGAIDSEGTARTIVDVLNRSNARGTLGANRFALA
jgi:hypothetical protein